MSCDKYSEPTFYCVPVKRNIFLFFFFLVKFYGICIASVLSLKKLKNVRTQTQFLTTVKSVQSLDRVLLYCNPNKAMSLTKEIYVATYFEDVSLIFKGLWNLEAARGTTKYCHFVCCNRNFCYLEGCLSYSLGFLISIQALSDGFAKASISITVLRDNYNSQEAFVCHCSCLLPVIIIWQVDVNSTVCDPFSLVFLCDFPPPFFFF